jgi:hypothetical protein
VWVSDRRASPQMSDRPPIEVIGQGREPDGPLRPRRRAPRALRVVGYLALAAVASVAVWLAARPEAGTSAPVAARATGPATIVENPSPDGFPSSAPAYHDLTVGPAADHSFIAFAGHVLLFLRVTYAGTTPVRVVDGRVPQPGAYPDVGAGGLTAGTTANVTLRHGVPTEIFVRTRVDCSTVLAGAAVSHLELMTQTDTGTSRAQTLDVSALGAYWDEARHAACEPPDATRAVTTSVGGLHGVPRAPGALPEVDAVVSLHDSAGFDAVVRLLDPGSPAVTFVPTVETSGGAVVEGGGTSSVKVRWTIRSCPAEAQAPAPTLPLHVTVSDSQALVDADPGSAFAAAWASALLRACR